MPRWGLRTGCRTPRACGCNSGVVNAALASLRDTSTLSLILRTVVKGLYSTVFSSTFLCISPYSQKFVLHWVVSGGAEHRTTGFFSSFCGFCFLCLSYSSLSATLPIRVLALLVYCLYLPVQLASYTTCFFMYNLYYFMYNLHLLIYIVLVSHARLLFNALLAGQTIGVYASLYLAVLYSTSKTDATLFHTLLEPKLANPRKSSFSNLFLYS